MKSRPAVRARQMNIGAEAASGAVLLFLHADTWPPEDCVALAAGALGNNGVVAGAFSFALRERLRGGRLMEWLTNARSRCGHLPYGDQGLFVRRELFDALGGFPDWPVLEDVELLRRLKRVGRVVTLRPPVLTSARRWQQGGLLRTFVRHQLILLGYAAGLSPHSLARWRR
ncbi:MAG: glycosyltransferase family 2 protein [Limisphaerales bacterium]